MHNLDLLSCNTKSVYEYCYIFLVAIFNNAMALLLRRHVTLFGIRKITL